MADISDIVSVSITVQDRSAGVADFGRMLVAAYEPGVNQNSVRKYNLNPNGLSAMLTDGFLAKNPAYKMVASAAAQTPSSKDILVYSRPTALSQTLAITVLTPTIGRVYELKVNGTLCSFTAITAVASDICAGLRTLANAVTGCVGTHVPPAAVFTLTPAATFQKVDISDWRTDRLSIADNTVSVGIPAALNEAKGLDENGFYSVLHDANDAINIAEVAAWAESNKKIALHLTSDTANLTAGTGIGSTLKAASYNYSPTFFTKSPGQYLNAALGSRQFSRRVGSSVWALKNVGGVTRDKVSATELANLRTNKLITYTQTNGVNHSLDGWAPSGRYLDVTRDTDWIKAEIEIAVFNFFLNNEKVPYTDQGVAALVGVVKGVLLKAASYGIITLASIAMSAPKVSEVATADRVGRILPDVLFSATLAGAIQSTVIAGTVSV